MLTYAALASIRFYQHRISPHKGFRCAHSVLHGGTGCSGFAKQTILDTGLRRALPTIRHRFRDCRLAYDTLLRQHQTDPDGTDATKRKKARGSACLDTACCGVEGCATLPRACGGTRSTGGGAASRFCDVNPCDGDIGCGGFDICSCG